MIDVTVPQLGESVTEGTITKWLVKEGDVVEKDQPIAEIATDKADSELPAPASGRVTRLLAKEGDVVPVKTVIAQIDEGAAATQAGAHAASPPVMTKSDHPIAPETNAINPGAIGASERSERESV